MLLDHGLWAGSVNFSCLPDRQGEMTARLFYLIYRTSHQAELCIYENRGGGKGDW